MKIIILATLLLALALSGAAAWADTPLASSGSSTTLVAQSQGDTSQTSLDWGGVYRGILQKDKKAKIETTLTLTTNHRYTLSRKGSGPDGDGATIKGPFSWLADGGSVLLSEAGSFPARFKVGENRLWQLDERGKPLKDSVLVKIAEAPAPTLEGTKWLLVEITGSDVPFPVEFERPNFTLDADHGKVNGFSSCNRFFGDYAAKACGCLKLSELATTMMACPQMELEQQFLAALGRVDSYSLRGATLYLKQGDKRLLEFRVADDTGESAQDADESKSQLPIP